MMKQQWKNGASRVLSLALCLVMALVLLPATAQAKVIPTETININQQGYDTTWRYGQRVRSYLYPNSIGGLTRVESASLGSSVSPAGNKVIVEDYDNLYRIQSVRVIDMELPVWGGFHAGKDYNFMVFGDMNPQDDDSKEVYRIVKYSKDWQRLGSASLYGANTSSPFYSGSLRCAEYNGYLYIRTSHGTYKLSDGKKHQTNVSIGIRESDMEITDSWYRVESGGGYVSHSFNQFIIVDQDGHVVTVDQGDGHPRAIVLGRFSGDAGQDHALGSDVSRSTIQSYPGAVGDNSTGATVGGLAETSNGYVTLYQYTGGSLSGAAQRNVYLAFTDKNLKTTTVQVTSGYATSVPQMVSTGLDGGYILWNGWDEMMMEPDDVLHYARYDANGNVGPVQTAAGSLSDCAPIYWNGKVVWYVSGLNGGISTVPMFYTLTDAGLVPYQAAEGAGASLPSMAEANPQTVLLDGKPVTFQTYALRENGGVTNYIKLRDLAYYLNGTKTQFEVEWNAWLGTTIFPATPYTPSGSELSTPFSGNRDYTLSANSLHILGGRVNMPSIVLTDDKGGSYTYYKLRDMGRALGFNISYINGQIVINTNEPYSDAQ